MQPLTIFLSRLIGLFLLVLSLAMILHPLSFAKTGAVFIHDWPLLLVPELITFIAGLALVLAHNIWSGGVLPIVITLIGWITVIRGLVLFLTPADALVFFFARIDFENPFYVPSSITLLLGLYLTCMGFKLPQP